MHKYTTRGNSCWCLDRTTPSDRDWEFGATCQSKNFLDRSALGSGGNTIHRLDGPLACRVLLYPAWTCSIGIQNTELNEQLR